MNLVLSVLLLASFVIGVDVLVDGGADLATRFGGLFRAPDLAWPRGVQEEDGPRAWRRAVAEVRTAAGRRANAADAAAEVVEGGRAVASLARVRRR